MSPLAECGARASPLLDTRVVVAGMGSMLGLRSPPSLAAAPSPAALLAALAAHVGELRAALAATGLWADRPELLAAVAEAHGAALRTELAAEVAEVYGPAAAGALLRPDYTVTLSRHLPELWAALVEGWCVVAVTGRDLVLAVAAGADDIVMPNDVAWTDEDWAGIDTPVVIRRNLTFRGVRREDGRLPVWDSGYVSGKMRLANATVTWQDVFVHRSRRELPAMATATRPPSLPGEQRFRTVLPQPGCVPMTILPLVNRPMPLPPVPRPEDWCWPVIGAYDDLGVFGADLSKDQKQIPTGYAVHLINSTYVCDDYFSLECLQRLGNLGCYNVWPNYTAVAGSEVPPPPLPSTPAEEGGGSSSGAIIGGVVGGVVGGLLLAALVVWAVMLHRRRGQRARAAAAGAGAPGKGGGGNPEGAQTEVLCWPASSGQGSGKATSVTTPGGSQEPAIALTVDPGGDEEQPSTPSARHGDAFAARPLLVSAGEEAQGGSSHAGPARGSAAPTSTASSAFPHGSVPPYSSGNMDFEGITEMAVVTLATPQRVAADAEVLLDPRVSLLPDRVLGKGSFGRVLEGRYQGRAVAVKLLHELPSLGHTAGKAGAGQPKPAQAGGQHGPVMDKSDVMRAAEGAQCDPPHKRDPWSAAADAAPAAGDEATKAAVALEGDQRQGLPTALHEPYENLTQEVEVLGRCKHPNVVELLAACLTPPRCALVMELCDTSLERLMYGSPGNLLPMDTVFDVATDVARGLHYLHPTIVHRDLKPGNVLVNLPQGRRLVAKLSDFGLSRMRSTVLITAHPEVGTPAYMAPELFDVNNFVVSHKADVFSYGVLLWAMLSGQEPWKDHNCVQVACAVLMLQRRLPYGCIPSGRQHPRLMSLISSCWDHDPDRRPAASDVLKLLLLAQEERQLETRAAAGEERRTPPPPLVPPPADAGLPAAPRALHALKQRVAINTQFMQSRPLAAVLVFYNIALAIVAGANDIVVPNDAAWTDEDWTGIDTPVVVTRNLTVRGVRREDGRLPVWDSGYVSGKMRLVNTTVTWQDFFIHRSRRELPHLINSTYMCDDYFSPAGGGGGGGSSTGAIIGGAVGGAVGGLLLAALVVWAVLLHRRLRERARAADAAAAAGKGGAEGADGASAEVHCFAASSGPGSGTAAEGTASLGTLPDSQGPAVVLPVAPGGDADAPSTPVARDADAFAATSLLACAAGEEAPGVRASAAPTSAADSARLVGSVPAFGSGNTDFEGITEMAVVTLATPQRVAADAEVLLDPRVSLLPDRVLGKGSFGRVLEGRYQGRVVAVKLLHELPSQAAVAAGEAAIKPGVALEDDEMLGLPTALHEPYENLAQEVEVLGRCKHPNVVELLAACLMPPRCALVMELCDTSLERLMYDSPGNLLPMDTVFDVATDVARGLHYLHPTIVHRDLKPGNVLVNMPPGRRLLAKLSDFGLSRIRSTVLVTEHPEVGTPAYMAPELFDVNNFVVSHKADVFSFGVLLWAMLSGQEPWKGHNCVQVAYAVLMLSKRLPCSSIPPDRRHPRLMSLIESCGEHDPARRPAAADVLKLLLLAQEEHQVQTTVASGGERPTPPPPLVPPPAHADLPAAPRTLDALKLRADVKAQWGLR
ncbi:hypothetical protein HYH03_017381 [Edaphochlamys debaryana]|uniref:Protein kinase domain-containing protein n=1 Tax=Edaphochlamys debaryana TaxID=47281 RepID=A0A835XMP7_9CHLO|nr:hypothetical protein HYH03_017381 [Edaphochlamys debaryana]|eukprot:KAG2483785.1 hypothetical protein HYH03_017381 [Edaphochlamys debaryana]